MSNQPHLNEMMARETIDYRIRDAGTLRRGRALAELEWRTMATGLRHSSPRSRRFAPLATWPLATWRRGSGTGA